MEKSQQLINKIHEALSNDFDAVDVSTFYDKLSIKVRLGHFNYEHQEKIKKLIAIDEANMFDKFINFYKNEVKYELADLISKSQKKNKDLILEWFLNNFFEPRDMIEEMILKAEKENACSKIDLYYSCSLYKSLYPEERSLYEVLPTILYMTNRGIKGKQAIRECIKNH